MSKKSMDPSDTGVDDGAAPPAPQTDVNPQTAADLAELLRSVMRSIERESALIPLPPHPPPPPPPPPAPPPLPQKAQDAVAQFRIISADLEVATVFTV